MLRAADRADVGSIGLVSGRLVYPGRLVGASGAPRRPDAAPGLHGGLPAVPLVFAVDDATPHAHAPSGGLAGGRRDDLRAWGRASGDAGGDRPEADRHSLPARYVGAGRRR